MKMHQLVAGFFSAYQPLSHAESLQLEREMSKVVPDMAREKVIRLTNPFIELGIHRGEGARKGVRKGARKGAGKGGSRGRPNWS